MYFFLFYLKCYYQWSVGVCVRATNIHKKRSIMACKQHLYRIVYNYHIHFYNLTKYQRNRLLVFWMPTVCVCVCVSETRFFFFFSTAMCDLKIKITTKMRRKKREEHCNVRYLCAGLFIYPSPSLPLSPSFSLSLSDFLFSCWNAK